MNMRIAYINCVPYGSTGKIVDNLASVAANNGFETFIFFGPTRHTVSSKNKYNYIGSLPSKAFHMYLSRITGNEGGYSYFSTKRLVKRLEEIKPDIIHLHNLHGWYLNFEYLFSYLKKSGVKIVWTLHDCWSFTGHCPHYQLAKCDKWKKECFCCPIFHNYPGTFIDNSSKMFRLKKALYQDLSIHFVTPSEWLKKEFEQSFLKRNRVSVINNGIDLSIFKPTKSDIRNKYGIKPTDYVVLGVSYGWGYNKGLDVFCDLSKKLPSNYRIVLVGTDSKVDSILDENIIAINRTDNIEEMVKLYSTADVFLNPTREDNFPTVNMEAIACGCPVVTFNTGGSPEMLNSSTGVVLESNDSNCAVATIKKICEEGAFKKKEFYDQSYSFNMWDRFEEYMRLYKGELGLSREGRNNE